MGLTPSISSLSSLIRIRQVELSTPNEAASIAATSATAAAAAMAALVPVGVGGGGSSLVEWVVARYELEGDKLAKWVASHFPPSLREAVAAAVGEAEVHGPTC